MELLDADATELEEKRGYLDRQLTQLTERMTQLKEQVLIQFRFSSLTLFNGLQQYHDGKFSSTNNFNSFFTNVRPNLAK